MFLYEGLKYNSDETRFTSVNYFPDVGGFYMITLNPGVVSDYFGNLIPIIGTDSAYTLCEIITKLAYSVS